MRQKFLFHTGSIKRVKPNGDTARASPPFLFHTGSIKRELMHRSATKPGFSFYSILVRLKGFMNAIGTLYGILVARVKSIFTDAGFGTYLLSTDSRANSLGG